jgi:hypothetical protein
MPSKSSQRINTATSAAILGMIEHLKLDKILGKEATPERQCVLGMIVARIIRPHSKLATTTQLEDYVNPECLGLEGNQ